MGREKGTMKSKGKDREREARGRETEGKGKRRGTGEDEQGKTSFGKNAWSRRIHSRKNNVSFPYFLPATAT